MAKNKEMGNVPNLRFPEFKGEWETKRLKDLGSFFSGGTPKTTNRSYYTGHISFIRSGEINSDVTELRISEEGLKNSSAKMVDKGEILIALYGATSGEIAVSKIYGAINQAILCFDTRENKQFFKNLWGKHKDDVLKTYLQGGQGNLSAEIIKQLKFHFPLKEEQNKIASFCELIEERIQTQSKIIRQLETSMENLRERLFSQQIRFKNDSYPEWEEKKLKDIAQKRITKNKDLNTKLVLTNSAIHGIVNQRDFFDKDIANKNNIDGYYLVEKDDFVYNPRISNEAPVGPISRNKIDRGIMSPLYMVFRFNGVNLDFIEQFYKTKIWHKHMENISNFGARADRMSFLSNDFFQMPILLPSSLEQKAIADFLSSFTSKVELAKQLLLKYETQKKYLLQNLFI